MLFLLLHLCALQMAYLTSASPFTINSNSTLITDSDGTLVSQLSISCYSVTDPNFAPIPPDYTAEDCASELRRIQFHFLFLSPVSFWYTANRQKPAAAVSESVLLPLSNGPVRLTRGCSLIVVTSMALVDAIADAERLGLEIEWREDWGPREPPFTTNAFDTVLWMGVVQGFRKLIACAKMGVAGHLRFGMWVSFQFLSAFAVQDAVRRVALESSTLLRH